jgi:hypothetical protein
MSVEEAFSWANHGAKTAIAAKSFIDHKLGKEKTNRLAIRGFLDLRTLRKLFRSNIDAIHRTGHGTLSARDTIGNVVKKTHARSLGKYFTNFRILDGYRLHCPNVLESNPHTNHSGGNSFVERAEILADGSVLFRSARNA